MEIYFQDLAAISMSTRDSRIKELAREAARKIKSLTDDYNAQIEQIYQEFQSNVEAIKREASTDSLTGSGAGSLPQTETNR